jgi:hypothetical protein
VIADFVVLALVGLALQLGQRHLRLIEGGAGLTQPAALAGQGVASMGMITR